MQNCYVTQYILRTTRTLGAEKLESLLLSAAGAEDLLARVETVLADYRGRREPFDDATMMVVKVG